MVVLSRFFSHIIHMFPIPGHMLVVSSCAFKIRALGTGFLQEADRIVSYPRDVSVFPRIGALASHVHCLEFRRLRSMTDHFFSDMEFASYKRHLSRVTELCVDLGYTGNFMVRRLYGTSRLVLHDPPGNRYLQHSLPQARVLPRHTIRGAVRGQ